MSALLVGYARCSTDQQDLTAPRDALLGLGVETDRIYVDHGLTGTNRERPGLREALAACRAGDTLVVSKLDRLARSLPDARAIADELTTRQISLSLGGSAYDPTDAVGRLLFNVLAMVAEFRPDRAPHPRGHEGREGQGPSAWQAAQAQPPSGSHRGHRAAGGAGRATGAPVTGTPSYAAGVKPLTSSQTASVTSKMPPGMRSTRLSGAPKISAAAPAMCSA